MESDPTLISERNWYLLQQRDLDGVQRAGDWSIVDVGHVRMPHGLTGAGLRCGNAVLHDV